MPVIVRIARVAGKVIWVFIGGRGQVNNCGLLAVVGGWRHLTMEAGRSVMKADQDDKMIEQTA